MKLKVISYFNELNLRLPVACKSQEILMQLIVKKSSKPQTSMGCSKCFRLITKGVSHKCNKSNLQNKVNI